MVDLLVRTFLGWGQIDVHGWLAKTNLRVERKRRAPLCASLGLCSPASKRCRSCFPVADRKEHSAGHVQQTVPRLSEDPPLATWASIRSRESVLWPANLLSPVGCGTDTATTSLQWPTQELRRFATPLLSPA